MDKAIGKIRLSFASALEQGIEPFEEALREDPEKAIQDFEKHIERTLNTAGGFFRGYMCGGPAPEITGTFIDKIGIVYHKLSRELRAESVDKSLELIHTKNYVYAQLDVERINNPWLAADMVVNGFNLWCGYAQYKDLQECKDWIDFENKYVQKTEHGKRLKAMSEFWLARAIADTDYTSEYVRQRFEEELPELTDMTKDAIAALIDDHARYWNATVHKPDDMEPYEQGVERRLNKYDPRWRDDLVKKIGEKKWIVLPLREQQYTEEYHRRFMDD